MKMASKSHSNASFWPGYVDAIVNALLNILFLVGVFAVALATSSSFQKNERLKDVPKLAKANEPTQIPTIFVDVQKTPNTEQVKSSREIQPIRWRWQQGPEQVRSLKIDFDPLALVMKEAGVGLLQALLKAENERQPGQRWKLWCIADTAGSDGTRLAYLRAMAVREAMVLAGIQTTRIDMRIFSGEKTDSINFNSVFVSVEPMEADKKTAPLDNSNPRSTESIRQ
jgi:hypothetical protein